MSESLPEFDRVVDEARVAVVEADLLSIERYGFLSGGRPLKIVTPLPVVGFDGTAVGFATVYWEQGHLMVTIRLTWDCEERLLLEAGEKIYVESEFVTEEPTISLRALSLALAQFAHDGALARLLGG